MLFWSVRSILECALTCPFLSFRFLSVYLKKKSAFTTHIFLDSKVDYVLRLPHMQKAVGIAFYQLLLSLIFAVSIFVSAAFVFVPVQASALEMTSETSQVLPPGGSSCAPMSATDFTPYIYDGALHSFEFTVRDASYVALVGSVGNTSLPFHVMTRRVDASGSLRIHVDIATTPIRGTLPIQITLLSARVGQPVCLGVVSINVGSGPTQPRTPVAYTAPASPKPSKGIVPASLAPSSTSTTPTPTTQQTVATSATVTPSVIGTMQSPLRNICASEASAYRLWLILLVLFTIVVGGALWAEFPMSLPWARTPERVATLILSLLLLLLAFWYLSVACRAALWLPLLAFLIAVLGLLAAFWNHPRVTQLLLIQDSRL